MEKSQSLETGKILYISEYGADSNETILHAVNMPVIIAAYLDDDGTLDINLHEKTVTSGQRLVCRTTVVPSVPPPARLKDLERDKCLEDNIAKTVSGWISIFMRDGVFCTDSRKETFLQSLDLRDIAERLRHNLDDVYNRYRDEYK